MDWWLMLIIGIGCVVGIIFVLAGALGAAELSSTDGSREQRITMAAVLISIVGLVISVIALTLLLLP